MSFYAVKIGRNKGIYPNWIECERQVEGFKGAKYKKFGTRIEAENFIDGTIVSNERNISTSNVTNVIVSNERNLSLSNTSTERNALVQLKIDPQTTIYGDGGFNNVTKPDAWGSVVNGYGSDLICHYSHLLTDMNLKEVNLPVGRRVIIVTNFSEVTHQNNGAELLACVAALRIALNLISNGIPVLTVFCDSQVILYWSIRLKSESAATFDPKKVLYINELIQLRKQFESFGGSLSKIKGEKNLSDIGFHKSK